MNRTYLLLGTAALMAISIANASAKDKPSEAFLKKAIEGNFAEISMGGVAQKNGQSDAVKSFGKMLSTDHAAANQAAMDAAKGMGMNPPSGPNAKQKADYDKMSKMSGAAFDKMFAKLEQAAGQPIPLRVLVVRSVIVVCFGVLFVIVDVDLDRCSPPWWSYEWTYLFHLGASVFRETPRDIFQV